MKPLFPTAALLLAIVGPVSAQDQGSQDDRCLVDDLREQYSNTRAAITTETDRRMNDADDLDEKVDFEEKGCISDYGVSGSWSLSGLADNFLQRIKDAACSAADDYIANQANGLKSAMDAPLSLADMDVGVEQGQSGVNVGEREGRDIDFDVEGAIRDRADRLPDVNSGYYDYDGGSAADDYDYIRENYNSGGRR